MRVIKQVSVVGLGLLGASVSLSMQRSMGVVKIVGYSHRESTRQKARLQGIAAVVADTLEAAVEDADLVILATPIRTFERYFKEMSGILRPGAIVTDVGSTKGVVHRWAAKLLPKQAHFVGSHPIAGSEKQGLDYGRDDLLLGARCILTRTKGTDVKALAVVRSFWEKLGCTVEVMTPAAHDRTLGMVSHLPHITAASLVNANRLEDLYSAGKGFMDTSRVASGPANIWMDILLTNPEACVAGIDKLIAELERFRSAIDKGDEKELETLLEQARQKREQLIAYKLERKELF
jgi:prephenate dehydrogenase